MIGRILRCTSYYAQNGWIETWRQDNRRISSAAIHFRIIVYTVCYCCVDYIFVGRLFNLYSVYIYNVSASSTIVESLTIWNWSSRVCITSSNYVRFLRTFQIEGTITSWASNEINSILFSDIKLHMVEY